MIIKLLIVSPDSAYEKHLSNVLSNIGDRLYEITTLTQKSGFIETMQSRNYDIVLFEQSMFDSNLNFKNAKLFVVLSDEETGYKFFNNYSFIKRINKYQRISNISREILDYYSQTTDSVRPITNSPADITAVFSPAGGCGKTSVAIAYAMNLANLTADFENKKNVFYLSLENFSSTHAYFPNNGKSLSDILSKLDKANAVTLMALKQHDERSGISYFSMPNNYDDINIINETEIDTLINLIMQSGICDKLIIDLSSLADKKTRKILERADNVLLVTDQSQTARQKLAQFSSQYNIFEKIRNKTTLIINKDGSDKSKADGVDGIGKNIKLPFLNLSDNYVVCEKLSKILHKEMELD